MYVDGNMIFGLPTVADGTATISTNVYDAGSAIKVFSGPRTAKLFYNVNATAGSALTIKLDFVGSDVVGCSGNTNIVIASTGILDHSEAGVLWTTAGYTEGALDLSGQTKAKRYYAVILTIGGGGSLASIAGGVASVVLDAQTNMSGLRAAIPA